MVDADVATRFGAVPHWAKVELPQHPGMVPFHISVIKHLCAFPRFRDCACERLPAASRVRRCAACSRLSSRDAFPFSLPGHCNRRLPPA